MALCQASLAQGHLLACAWAVNAEACVAAVQSGIGRPHFVDSRSSASMVQKDPNLQLDQVNIHWRAILHLG